ncbi:MAG: tetratricopeptide repeat protein [Bacteroidota bacterium]|nr:tetratricopeptide repeat protein [Bacteroidota bacterium]
MKITSSILYLMLLCSGLFSQQEQNQNILRLAQAFEQQQEYERALQLYSDLFVKDTTNYVYFDALRRMFVQLKRYDDAIALSVRRLRSTPFDFTLQSNIGSLFSMAGKEQKADSVWNLVLQSSNKNQMFFRAVANEQVNQRLFYKAIASYIRGRNEIGDQFVFANELGYLYSFTMDFSNTTREYLRMLRQNEQQFDFVQSRLAAIISRPDGLTSCTAVVEEELHKLQTIPLMRIQMWLYMEANRYSDAFVVTQKIEQLVNSNGQELFAFAERVFRENEFSVAAIAYQQALQTGSRMAFIPAAKFGYARCVEELSLHGERIEEIKKENNSLLETQPSFSGAINLYSAIAKEYSFSAISANALYRIGWIRYKQMFDLDGALQMFDSVMLSSPAGPMVPTVLAATGDIYIAQNKLDAASKKYNLMASSPFSNQEQRTAAQFRLAEIQFFKNNFDSVLVLLAPLTENLKVDESNDALILQYFVTENQFQFLEALKQYSRSELLARQYKLSEAIQELSSIIDIYPAAPLADDVLLKKAEYSIQLKKYADALADYQKLLVDYQESIEKDRTQFRIGELYELYLGDKQKAIAAYEVILEKYPFSLFVEQARKKIRQLRGDSI